MNIKLIDQESLQNENKIRSSNIQNSNVSMSTYYTDINVINFPDKFNQIRLEIVDKLTDTTILWTYDTTVDSHINYLAYFSILNLIHPSNKKIILLSNKSDSHLEDHDAKATSLYETFSNFDIGTITMIGDIYYTKDYQTSFFRVSRAVTINEVKQCVEKKVETPIDVNMESASSLLSILVILNNIIYFDISHILIGEQEGPLYELIKSILLNKFETVLHIIRIPILPDLLDSCRYEQILCLESSQKSTILNYLTAINKMFSDEQSAFDIDMNITDLIENIKTRILLPSKSHNTRPIYVAVSFLTDQFFVLKKTLENECK